MVKKLAIISVVASLLLLGCEAVPQKTPCQAQRLDSASWMMSYLKDQQLPVLESVDLWENSFSQGLKITTKHYEIYTTLLDPLLLVQIPGFMESAYAAYQHQVSLNVESNSKAIIYLFKNRAQWEKFTRDFAGFQSEVICKIKAGAYYLNGSCVAYNIGRERTFSALGHEGWHQFNGRHFKFRLPSWLDEGIAVQFEKCNYVDGRFSFEPTDNVNRLIGLKKTMAGKQMIPVDKLLALNPGEVISVNHSEQVTAFYSQAYAMIRFLREENCGRNLTALQDLLADGLYGRWPLADDAEKIAIDRNIPLTVQWNQIVGLELFKYYIDDDLEKLQEDYLVFCRKIVYRL